MNEIDINALSPSDLAALAITIIMFVLAIMIALIIIVFRD